MKTLRQELETHLYNHGLFQQEAAECVNSWAINSPTGKVSAPHLDKSADHNAVLVAWMGLSIYTHRWLKQTYPEHWAIGVFAEFDK